MEEEAIKRICGSSLSATVTRLYQGESERETPSKWLCHFHFELFGYCYYNIWLRCQERGVLAMTTRKRAVFMTSDFSGRKWDLRNRPVYTRHLILAYCPFGTRSHADIITFSDSAPAKITILRRLVSDSDFSFFTFPYWILLRSSIHRTLSYRPHRLPSYVSGSLLRKKKERKKNFDSFLRL